MRTKIMLLALITVAVSLVAASFATAQTTFKLKAAMNIGQETTRVKGAKAGAAGRFTATLNGTTLKWTLTFKNLSGPATAAHIHTAPKGVAGPVTVPLCNPCTSPVSGTTVLRPTRSKIYWPGRTTRTFTPQRTPAARFVGRSPRRPRSRSSSSLSH